MLSTTGGCGSTGAGASTSIIISNSGSFSMSYTTYGCGTTGATGIGSTYAGAIGTGATIATGTTGAIGSTGADTPGTSCITGNSTIGSLSV